MITSLKLFATYRNILLPLAFLLGVAGCQKKEEPKEVKLLSAKQTAALIRMSSSGRVVAAPWAEDIHASLTKLKLEPTKRNICTTISIIEQESNFQADPPVQGISRMLFNRIDAAKKNFVVGNLLDIRLKQKAENGKTFLENAKRLKTEKDLEEWYKEFAATKITSPLLSLFKKDLDTLISTIGSMQVSVKFAERFAQKNHVAVPGELRAYLYTREGGLYFGMAHLLEYPADYSAEIYRFADYNAGQYASRNAGFQRMVARLSDRKLMADGDLLRHDGSAPEQSETYLAVVDALLKNGESAVRQKITSDLGEEGEPTFSHTATYATIQAIYQKKYGNPILAELPEIDLHSDKISRPLTTKWYANRVNGRFERCMRERI
jgi:hypothetical protein